MSSSADREILGPPAAGSSKRSRTDDEKPINAFTKLMAPKKPKSTNLSSSPPAAASSSATAAANTSPGSFKNRMGLGAYLADPTSWPPSIVISHTPEFVFLRDKFPKSTVHALLLPRSAQHNLRHPFDALADAQFLAAVRAEVDVLRKLVATELQRRLGRYSASDAARQAVLDGTAEPEGGGGAGGQGESEERRERGEKSRDPPSLPNGRDWLAQIRCGVHAVPSMSHLHVHVLSRDMHSPIMRHRKHYNSFATPFFVDLDDFPLAPDDPRRDPGGMGYLRRDLVCWRCGQNFGNQFKRLKEHLEVEFEAWRAE